MIFVFSCYRKDLTGEKEVIAFRQFPSWQDIQISVNNGLNFFPMKQELTKAKRNFDLGINRVFSWEYMEHVCQFFIIEVINNGR